MKRLTILPGGVALLTGLKYESRGDGKTCTNCLLGGAVTILFIQKSIIFLVNLSRSIMSGTRAFSRNGRIRVETNGWVTTLDLRCSG
jgi:hypothetical protein